MQHRVKKLVDNVIVSARSSDPRADEYWAEGGWQTCVGRWAVVWAMPGSYGEQWAVFPSLLVARFSSKRRAEGYARHRRSQAHDFNGPNFRARVIRWRRDLDVGCRSLATVPRFLRALRIAAPPRD